VDLPLGVPLLFIISNIVLSSYAAGLQPEFIKRYVQKIQIISFDPFIDAVTFDKKLNLPPTSLIDIYNYFVLSKSFYTGNDRAS
jgi:hypothetical protein